MSLRAEKRAAALDRLRGALTPGTFSRPMDEMEHILKGDSMDTTINAQPDGTITIHTNDPAKTVELDAAGITSTQHTGTYGTYSTYTLRGVL